MPASPEEPPKLRLAPLETPEQLAHRVEREERAELLQREHNLEHSLAPFRVGSVGYLNSVPLTRGIEDEVVFTTPARMTPKPPLQIPAPTSPPTSACEELDGRP